MRSADGRKRVRAAGILLCGVALAVAPMMAQTDGAQAGPPQNGAEQGPPPGGPGGHGRGGRENPERRLERLQRQLNLTEAQVTQVKALFEEGRTKMEALHANTAVADEDKRAQGMAIHKEEHEKLVALLTPEQKTKFEAMEQHMREHGPRGGDGQGPPPPPPPPPPTM